MPARKMKVGAQKCVIQRVRNSAGSATSRGLKAPGAKKSRVWSSAISTMTRPRTRSMETMRVRSAVAPLMPDPSGALSAAGATARRSDSKVRLMTRSFPQAPLGARALVRRRAAPWVLAGDAREDRAQVWIALAFASADCEPSRGRCSRLGSPLAWSGAIPVVSARFAQRAHGQSFAHRRFDLAPRDADIREDSVVEPVELANGAAQASTRGQVVQHPGAAHREDAEPLGERMQSAAQAGLHDEGALDAGPPLAFDERRQRDGVDSLGHG